MNLEAELRAAVSRADADSRLLHEIVHGDAAATVDTEGGPVKTAAKAIGDVEASVAAATSTVTEGVAQAETGVDPNSWTPDPLGRRYPPCRDQDRRTRRSSGARWLSWCEPDGVRKSCHESSSRRRRRSATGSCKPSVTRGVAGMGQAPRSERSCVAFAERIVGCAKNEISWQKPRPGLLGGPYRGGLPVHESESGRVSNRHDGPSARSLPERVLRVAHP